MIKVDFDPNKLTGEQAAWWTAWHARAQSAIAKAIADIQAKRPHNFNQTIWKELKDWLRVNVFNRKCAYCETLIDAGFYGDAEHYRPKGRVHGVPEHPGYYWLAYHWKNLIPSCQMCNSGTGKGDQFPLPPGKRHVTSPDPARVDPDALRAIESPLLLHPYEDDPRDHLVFGAKGTVSSKSERGQKTIELCELTRDALCQARQQWQETAYNSYLIYAAARNHEGFRERYGSQPYWAAVRDYVKMRWKEDEPSF
jgi:uncharacterized protein (TIGR02646 family)